MRTIRIPADDIRLATQSPGRCVVVPVKVDWPELQLTEAQIVQNALAFAEGKPRPFPDRSVFQVELETPAP